MLSDSRKLEALLPLKRKIIGVKLVTSREAFDRYEAVSVRSPISYCTAVRTAASGGALKFTAEQSACPGSSRALGLKPVTPDFFTGESGYRLGLYADQSCAASVAKKMERLEYGTYGVIVKPLDQFEDAPDVVLVVANSRTMMRLVQGYTYFYGTCDHFCFTGNQAICVEATAIPLRQDRMNLSVMCAGTRAKARWDDNELVAGLPYGKFHSTVEGVRRTANAVESDARKKEIIQALTALDCPTDDIQLGDAYYMRLERKAAEER